MSNVLGARFWLAAVVILGAAASLLLPLPSDITSIGFSNLVLLNYPPFVILYVATCMGLAIWWYRARENLEFGLIVILTSILFVPIWETKMPGGFVYGESIFIAGAVKSILSTGFIPAGSELNSLMGITGAPGIFTLFVPISSLTGMTVVMAFALFSFVRAVCLGLFSFLVARELTISNRTASMAAILSLVGNPFALLPTDSPYAESAVGVVLFFITTFCLVKSFKSKSIAWISASIIFILASSITYIFTTTIIIILLMTFLLSQKLGLFKPKLTFHPKLLTFAIISFSTVYFIGQASYSIVLDWIEGFFESSANTNLHYHSFALLIHLKAYFGNEPVPLLLLQLFWVCLFLVALGKWAWELPHVHSVTHIAVIALFISGIPLLFLIGGYDETRLIYEMPLFLGVVLVNSRFPRKRPRDIFMFGIFLIMLPTLVAFYPSAGIQAAQYSSSFAAGNFLSNSACVNAKFFSVVGIASFNPLLMFNSATGSILPPANLSSYGTQLSQQAIQLYQDRCGVVNVNPLLYTSLAYQFGPEVALELRLTMTRMINTNPIIYNNGETVMGVGSDSR